MKPPAFSSKRVRFILFASFFLGFAVRSLSQTTGPIDEIIARIFLNDIPGAKALISKAPDLSAKSSAGMTVLIAVAMSPGLDNPDLFNDILERKPAVNARDANGVTALFYAASEGKLDLLNSLLKMGADPNITSDSGPPLVGAVENNQNVAATRLLEIPTLRIDVSDRFGRTALMFAAIHGQQDLTRALLMHGAQPNIYETITGNTPLLWAAAMSAPTVGVLLDSSADPRLVNPFTCQTAMHIAVWAQNRDVVKFLLAHGIRADLADFEGRTPLGLARQRGSQEIWTDISTALNARGMNVLETDKPPNRCNDPHLITLARARVENNTRAAAEDFLSLAQSVVGSWSEQRKIFLNPDVPQFLDAQIRLFRDTICFRRADLNLLTRCRQLLSNGPQLRSIISNNLDLVTHGNSVVPTIPAQLASQLGIEWIRTGWPDKLPNKTLCSSLPTHYSKEAAYFIDPTGPIQINPGETLCLRPGSYSLVVPSKSVELKTDFSLGTTMDASFTATPLSNQVDLYARTIAPSREYLCLGVQNTTNPLTQPLPLRDDVLIPAPKLFSTARSATLSIKDPSHLCNSECQAAVKIALIKSIAAWELGCTRCLLSNLLVLKVGDTRYFNSKTVRVLEGFLSHGAPFPADNQFTRSAGRGEIGGPIGYDPSLIFGYELLDRSSSTIKSLCKPSLPAEYQDLCVDKSASDDLVFALEISNSSQSCGDADAIACATPDRIVSLRAYDHVFSISIPGRAMPIVFGHGSTTVDLITVLTHEIGHFFGIPHLDESLSAGSQRKDVMFPIYNRSGCVTRADYTMLNQAVDPRWPFRLDGCAGLRF